MKTKTDAEVIIGGKRYSLSGYESEEYLQKVASYINGKLAELKNIQGYRTLDMDTKIVLMEINIADDYFKLKQSINDVTAERDTQNDEIYNLKHDIIELQKELEATRSDRSEKMAQANKAIENLKSELVEEQKKYIKLETENSAAASKFVELQKTIQKLEAENEALKAENAAIKRRLQK